MRQHLATLRAEGLVERRREAARAGRPHYLYRLSEAGRRAYPKRYDVLLDELLGVLVEREGATAALEIVAEAGARLGRGLLTEIPPTDPEVRRRAAIDWLESAFDWDVTEEEGEDGTLRLVVHRCPLQDVPPDQALVCGAFFTKIVATLLEARSVRHVPIADGLRCCAIEVELPEREPPERS